MSCWSLIQQSLTKCDVSEGDHKALLREGRNS